MGQLGHFDLCYRNPGFEVDLFIEASLRVLTQIWLGHLPIDRAKREGLLRLDGSRIDIAAFRSWFALSRFAAAGKMELWAQRWLRHDLVNSTNLDPDLLMWDIRRNVAGKMPPRDRGADRTDGACGRVRARFSREFSAATSPNFGYPGCRSAGAAIGWYSNMALRYGPDQ